MPAWSDLWTDAGGLNEPVTSSLLALASVAMYANTMRPLANTIVWSTSRRLQHGVDHQMIRRRDHVTLEMSRSKPPHEVDAPARCVDHVHPWIPFPELVLDLRESRQQAPRVTDVQRESEDSARRWSLSVQARRRHCRLRTSKPAALRNQNATSIEAETVRGWPRCAV